MTQPSMPDGPPVPLLVEGLIDVEMLRRLFLDLSFATRIVSLQEKGGPTDYSAATDWSLDDVFQRLQSGTSRAAQVRYQYDGTEWTDSILATAAGFRVVRCRHESG